MHGGHRCVKYQIRYIILTHSRDADTCAHIIGDNAFPVVNGTSTALPIDTADYGVLATHTH